MLALMGLPPFGLFVSEVMIFGAGFRVRTRRGELIGLVLLLIAFAGSCTPCSECSYGEAAAAGWRLAPGCPLR
jgi:NADH:ubiquinone oxidoreductase subunit 5 (subunit L)/multisubunit Na+/H+ antiporter MnhA subunit